MSTSYIYSSSRVKTLEKSLLSEADIERLLSVTDTDELLKTLKDTHLNSLTGEDKIDNIFSVLEKTNLETKNLLEKISPEPELFSYFWFRFDIHNLRVILRALKVGKGLDEVLPYMSKLGKYDPVVLFERAKTGTLEQINSDLKNIYDRAIKVMGSGLTKADQEFDKGYFLLAESLVNKTDNRVLAELLKLQIDLYNLKTGLRSFALGDIDSSWFVNGGSFAFTSIDTQEKLLARLNTFGGERFWKKAVSEYLENGHFTTFNVKLDEYLLVAIKGMDNDVFSVATLVSYLLKQQNVSLNIQAIVIGKENKQSGEVIRKQLRAIYV